MLRIEKVDGGDRENEQTLGWTVIWCKASTGLSTKVAKCSMAERMPGSLACCSPCPFVSPCCLAMVSGSFLQKAVCGDWPVVEKSCFCGGLWFFGHASGAWEEGGEASNSKSFQGDVGLRKDSCSIFRILKTTRQGCSSLTELLLYGAMKWIWSSPTPDDFIVVGLSLE